MSEDYQFPLEKLIDLKPFVKSIKQIYYRTNQGYPELIFNFENNIQLHLICKKELKSEYWDNVYDADYLGIHNWENIYGESEEDLQYKINEYKAKLCVLRKRNANNQPKM